MTTSPLAGVPLFAQVPADALSELSARLRRRRYDRGATIFYQGDPGASLCIVQDGRVKLSLASPEGREIIIDLFGPGEVFGELALLDGEPRSADATAIEPSELLFLDRDPFLAFLLEHPQIMLQLLVVLGRRLRRDAQMLGDAAFLDVPARLARTILRLADTDAGRAAGMTPRLTQTDLAAVAGTTRETLNKWLGFFQQQGLIRLDRGRISVLDAHGLRRRIY